MPDNSSADELADRPIKYAGQLAGICVNGAMEGLLEIYGSDVSMQMPRFDE